MTAISIEQVKEIIRHYKDYAKGFKEELSIPFSVPLCVRDNKHYTRDSIGEYKVRKTKHKIHGKIYEIKEIHTYYIER